MRHSNSRNNPYESSTVKFICVILDENLTFKDHVNKNTSKISKSVGVIRRLHCQLPANEMVKLYYSLVYSHLTYALLAFQRVHLPPQHPIIDQFL